MTLGKQMGSRCEADAKQIYKSFETAQNSTQQQHWTPETGSTLHSDVKTWEFVHAEAQKFKQALKRFCTKRKSAD